MLWLLIVYLLLGIVLAEAFKVKCEKMNKRMTAVQYLLCVTVGNPVFLFFFIEAILEGPKK